MSGHGHVVPNKSGVKARCGGPAICSECAKELAQATASTTAAMQTSSDILNVDSSKPIVSMPTRILQLLLAEITELRRDAAIVKAEREWAWQPIETAPRDGTRILVLRPSRVPGQKQAIRSRVVIAKWHNGKWHKESMAGSKNSTPAYAIAWMPLPSNEQVR